MTALPLLAVIVFTLILHQSFRARNIKRPTDEQVRKLRADNALIQRHTEDWGVDEIDISCPDRQRWAELYLERHERRQRRQ